MMPCGVSGHPTAFTGVLRRFGLSQELFSSSRVFGAIIVKAIIENYGETVTAGNRSGEAARIEVQLVALG